jgi:hypothetical protein
MAGDQWWLGMINGSRLRFLSLDPLDARVVAVLVAIRGRTWPFYVDDHGLVTLVEPIGMGGKPKPH